jgi:cellulase/cellobiase CelA1
MGECIIDPYFLEFGTNWCGQIRAPAALPPAKNPGTRLEEVEWTQKPVRTLWRN